MADTAVGIVIELRRLADATGGVCSCGFLPDRTSPFQGTAVPRPAQTIVLLSRSNLFVTFAWYAHVEELSSKPRWIAAFESRGIALFEYLLQIPANRVGYTILSIPPPKILPAIIMLGVFVPFAFIDLKRGLKLDCARAGCGKVGAVYFMFRSQA